MRNDNDRGLLEDLAQRRDAFFLFRSVHSAISLAGVNARGLQLPPFAVDAGPTIKKRRCACPRSDEIAPDRGIRPKSKDAPSKAAAIQNQVLNPVYAGLARRP
jgi:hypothetical protein